MSDRVQLRLAKDLSRAIRQGHPWVFRDALEDDPGLDDGEVVDLLGKDGRPLATGYYDSRSAIAVRLLAAGSLADPHAEVEARIRAALALRRERLDPARTDAFRWIHGEGDRLPGMHVDLYRDVAVVRFDGSGAPAFYAEIGKRLAEAAKPLVLREVMDRQGAKRLYGPGAPSRFEVIENGLTYEVSPAHAGKGGLFLDQRENREYVGRIAAKKSVLNLFGYTGGFSMSAARGGAVSTDTVDTGKPALDVAKRNFERNGLDLKAARFHVADAFEFLEEAVRARKRWDIVVSDPPSFAPNEASRGKARHAYIRLHRLAAAATAKGGILCAASCSSHFRRDEFLDSIETGVGTAGRRWSLDQDRGAGFDHPVLKGFPEGDYLKFAVGRVT